MPELPEVEVVRLSLLPPLLARTIERVEIRSPGLREPFDHGLLAAVEGSRVKALRRRAKYLLIDLSAGQTLVAHLGMSGQLTVVSSRVEVDRHEHLAFHLDDGRRLRFVDPRRFGLAYVHPTDSLEDDPHLVHLGIEPFDDAFDGSFLAARAIGRRGPVKSFLMDGRVVVGVGNIYASEVLWNSRVHPRRSVRRIASRTWARLARQVVHVLGAAIEEGGTTLADFRDGEGNSGYFQVSLSVYGREGEPCCRCGRTIRRIVQSGRSTFYCPGCQR